MKFRAYPRYKPSGVEWLGDVPEHWDVHPVRRLVQEHRQGYYTDSSYVEYGVKLLRITDLHEAARISFVECPRVEALPTIQPFLLKSGDFVFARTGGAGTFGVVERLDEPVIHASYLIRFRFKKCANAHFLKYFFLSFYFREGVRKNIHGGVNQNVHAEDIKNQFSVLPSIYEQVAIAEFLDRETGRVDRLVAKKRELIERLKEKRTALISRTVTRGLPAEAAAKASLPVNPSLKPSGLDWLGDIPKHWQVLPFTKYVAEKSDYRGKTPDKQPDGVFLVTARNVRMGFIDYESSKEFIAEEDYNEVMRRGLPKKGDILFTTEAPLGNVALVDREDIALAQRIIRFRMSPAHYNSAFVLFAMMSDHFQVQLKSLSTGSTAEGLKASKLFILRLIAPPLPEQIAIAAYLDEETAKLDVLVGKVEEAVERLQEYRTALITAAVTGKMDVRTTTSSEK